MIYVYIKNSNCVSLCVLLDEKKILRWQRQGEIIQYIYIYIRDDLKKIIQ